MSEDSNNSEMASFWNAWIAEKQLSPQDSEYVEIVSSLESDTHFGAYQIIEKIGSGGMGCVYKVYDCVNKREVALKLIISADKVSAENMERFWREAKTTARLNHPYIITVYGMGEESGQPYFVMPFIAGKSLHEWGKSKRTYQEIIAVFTKICEGIHYAHQCGVIHRDLKPENIMLTEDHPFIMDFGLAKVNFANTKISRTGMVMGTLQYMAPEQAQGLVSFVDERSDIYSLGCILYYLLTGKPPFSEKGVYSFHFLYQILTKTPQSIHEYRTGIPDTLEKICFKALEKKKELRYQNVAQMIEDIFLVDVKN